MKIEIDSLPKAIVAASLIIGLSMIIRAVIQHNEGRYRAVGNESHLVIDAHTGKLYTVRDMIVRDKAE